MPVASRHHVLFRERTDGHWDYFPKGHSGRGYQVNAEQRERLIKLLKSEQLCYVAAMATLAGTLGAFVLVSVRLPDMWFVRWGPLIMALLCVASLSPNWLLRIRRLRLLREAAQAEYPMTGAEPRYRSADLSSAPRILLRLLFFTVLVAWSLVIACVGYLLDNLILIAGGAVVACIFGRDVWHWAQVYRGSRRLLKSRRGLPLVFD